MDAVCNGVVAAGGAGGPGMTTSNSCSSYAESCVNFQVREGKINLLPIKYNY